MPLVDEAAKEPALMAVREQLLIAAKAGDLNGVMSFVHSGVQATYDGKRGIEALKEEWEIEKSPKRFLNELALVLSLGGRFQETARTSFVAPALFIDFPDPAEMPGHAIVIHKNAPAYRSPGKTSAVLARLNDEVLPIVTAFPGWVEGWTEVTLPGGRRKAYMRWKDLRQPNDVRAYFTKLNGEWLLSGFYGGVD